MRDTAKEPGSACSSRGSRGGYSPVVVDVSSCRRSSSSQDSVPVGDHTGRRRVSSLFHGSSSSGYSPWSLQARYNRSRTKESDQRTREAKGGGGEERKQGRSSRRIVLARLRCWTRGKVVARHSRRPCSRTGRCALRQLKNRTKLTARGRSKPEWLDRPENLR